MVRMYMCVESDGLSTSSSVPLAYVGHLGWISSWCQRKGTKLNTNVHA